MSTLQDDVLNTLLPIYAGALVSSLLYGLTCLQTFYYFRMCKDRWLISVTVLILWCLDTAHQILISVDAWKCIVYFIFIEIPSFDWFGRELKLLRTAGALLLINMLVTELVNAFLAWRLWKLSGNKLLLSFIVVLLVGHLALNLTFIIHFEFSPFEISDLGVFGFSAPFFAESIAGLAIDCILDVVLAVGLVYYLSNSKSGFRKSGNMVTKMMAMTVSNGLLTSFFMIGQLISMINAHGPDLFYFFAAITGKMYINALLTSLNTREMLKATLGDQPGESLYLDMQRNSHLVARIVPERTINIMQSVPPSMKCSPNTSRMQHPDDFTTSGKKRDNETTA